MRLLVALAAGLTIAVSALLVGCGPPPEYGLNYSAGDTYDFANGWSAKLPPGWNGLAVVSDEPDEELSPAFVPLRLYGRDEHVVDIQLETKEDAESGVAMYRQLIEKGDWSGNLAETTYDDCDITLTYTPEIEGTAKQLLVMFIWDDDGPLYLQVTGDRRLDAAIGGGAPAQELVDMVIKSVGLTHDRK